MTWRAAAFVVAAVLTAGSLSAQSQPTVDQLLDRMADYMVEYETQLSRVVADERMEQEIVNLRPNPAGHVITQRLTKLIESEVSFIRLPGGTEWLGFRDVRKINGRPLRTPGLRLSELLRSGQDVIQQGKTIATAGAAHNLGLPRTINVPTAPLEIVHPRHRAAFKHGLAETESIDRVETVVVTFEEMARPTIVRHPDGHDLVSRARVWIEPDTGRIRRVDWNYRLEERGENAGPVPSLRVDFAPEKTLDILVPIRMDEVFAVPRATGRGTARYRNFRRFGTSARIVPQQP